MVDKVSVGKRIKNIRLSLGYTMEEFGQKLNPIATKGTVSKWENGRYLPNNGRLNDIAFYGRISVDELLAGDLVTINPHDLFTDQNDIRQYLVADISDDDRFHLTELENIKEDDIDTILKYVGIHFSMNSLPMPMQMQVKRVDKEETK